MLAPNNITLVETERRDLTIGYLKGAPGFYGFMVLISGGGGNASKLPFSSKITLKWSHVHVHMYVCSSTHFTELTQTHTLANPMLVEGIIARLSSSGLIHQKVLYLVPICEYTNNVF